MREDRRNFLIGMASIIAAVWGLSHMTFQGGEFGQCVTLPSGMKLGFEARFSFGNGRWGPFIVPKFANGTPLISGEIWPFYATDTTVGGVFEGRHREQTSGFAWRKDTGLIFKRDNQKLYAQLKSQAGPIVDGARAGGFPTFEYYDRLSNDPRYGLQDCRTRFFRW